MDKEGELSWKSADKPGSVENSHSSGIYITAYLMRPTREQCGPHFLILRSMSPYLVLLQTGFTLPPMSPCARCALTTPFQPYLCPKAIGGMFSVALSVDSRPPGVTWRLALWSPDFPPFTQPKLNKQRLPGRLPALV